MSKEFSMELVLCLIEISQLLELLQKQLINDKDLDLNEIESILSTKTENDANIFYTSMDAVLFTDDSYKSINFKILNFASTVPQSLIIKENIIKDINNIKNNDSKLINPLLRIKSNKQNNDETTTIMKEINFYLSMIAMYYNIGFGIYHKYIAYDCEFEVNIPYFLKSRFGSIFQTYNFIQFIVAKEKIDDTNELINNSNDNSNNTDTKLSKILIEMNKEMDERYRQNQRRFVDYIDDLNDNNSIDTDCLVNPNLSRPITPNITHIDSNVSDNNNNNSNNNTLNNVEMPRLRLDSNELSLIEASKPKLTNVANVSNASNVSNVSNAGFEIEPKENNKELEEKKASMLFETDLNELRNELSKNCKNLNANEKELNNEMKEKIRKNSFAFVLLLMKIMRKTNEEILSLLNFSFERFAMTQEFKNMIELKQAM